MPNELNILHLEDNENDAELVRNELETEQVEFSYKRVDNENDFISSISGNDYDIIISDFSLPSYNGLAALEKAVEIQPQTPFILVSGTLGEDAAVESMKKGATDYVLKNRLKKLVPTIRRAIEEVKEKKRRHLAENRFGNLIEAAQDMILTLSSAGRIVSLNKAFETITGLDRNDWIGKDYTSLIHPEDKISASEKFKSSVNGMVPESYEVRFLNSAGSYLVGEILTTPVIPGGNEVEILGIVRDITERKKNDEIIKRSLMEKELLLKEIHHRVKNNLQIISSLIKMQSQNFKNAEIQEVFRETQNRVMSMSYIHQSFYQSGDLTEINFDIYIQKLVNNLFNIYDTNPVLINFEIDTKGISMGVDTAIPCGLMINEMVSNSLKHAFVKGNRGSISITLDEKDGVCILNIKDNGRGIPDSVQLGKSTSLGMVLITMLCDQIDGSISLKREGGTEYEVRFPRNRYGNRLKDVSV
jgi:PAS domain S-box-containing protein